MYDRAVFNWSVRTPKTKSSLRPIRREVHSIINQWENRETAGRAGKRTWQIAMVFSFATDWLRRWREFSWQITEQIWKTAKQFQISFDTQLKIFSKWLVDWYEALYQKFSRYPMIWKLIKMRILGYKRKESSTSLRKLTLFSLRSL